MQLKMKLSKNSDKRVTKVYNINTMEFVLKTKCDTNKSEKKSVMETKNS